MKRHDVLIVGAGLAGAVAAERLSGAGLDVIVTEARERVGGRGFARSFGKEDGESLEFGGAWITPWQSTIRSLCARHGIGLKPRPPINERRWFRDGALHRDGPTSAADRSRHERALARIASDATLYKKGFAADEKGRPITGVSYADYLRRLDPPASTADLISAWWTVSGNGDKTRVPFSELLASSSYADGLTEAMIDVWVETLDGGVQALVEAIVAACVATVRRGAPVALLRHGEDGVTAVLADGSTIAARSCVVATGLNPMAGLSFDPPLSEARQTALADGHLGRCVKVWAKVQGVPVGVLATGGGTGIEWMFSERKAADGSTLIVGFGVEGNGWDPDLPSDIEAAVARFFPEGRFMAGDWHDWTADPFARGAWVAAIAGSEQRFEHGFWSPEPPLFFASSDFAPRDAGWFEGAAVSGEAAAVAIEALLGTDGSIRDRRART